MLLRQDMGLIEPSIMVHTQPGASRLLGAFFLAMTRRTGGVRWPNEAALPEDAVRA